MILTSTTERVPFTPPWFTKADGQPKDGAPRYFLRAGSVIERGLMEAELEGQYRAGRVYDFALRAALRAGVLALLSDDPDLDRVLGVVDEEEPDSLSAADKQLLADTDKIIAEHWPDYRDLRAQQSRRKEIAPIVALRRFCTGWENVKSDGGKEVPFALGKDDMIADASLALLQQVEISFAGNRAYSLQYAAGMEGNSERPGAAAKDPAISTLKDGSKAVGKSKASTTRKIRSTRSQRSSGPSLTSG